jgi:hypothetical protein
MSALLFSAFTFENHYHYSLNQAIVYMAISNKKQVTYKKRIQEKQA